MSHVLRSAHHSPRSSEAPKARPLPDASKCAFHPCCTQVYSIIVPVKQATEPPTSRGNSSCAFVACTPSNEGSCAEPFYPNSHKLFKYCRCPLDPWLSEGGEQFRWEAIFTPRDHSLGVVDGAKRSYDAAGITGIERQMQTSSSLECVAARQVACPPGEVTSVIEGVETCTPCPPGTYEESVSISQDLICKRADPNEYAPNPGMSIPEAPPRTCPRNTQNHYIYFEYDERGDALTTNPLASDPARIRA